MFRVKVSAYVPSTMFSAGTPVYETFKSLFTLTEAAVEVVEAVVEA